MILTLRAPAVVERAPGNKRGSGVGRLAPAWGCQAGAWEYWVDCPVGRPVGRVGEASRVPCNDCDPMSRRQGTPRVIGPQNRSASRPEGIIAPEIVSAKGQSST